MVSLIVSEAKPEKDDLMINDYDLKECEFGRKTIFVFSSHWKMEYDRKFANQADEVIPE
ncbi:MAG: hypothetical protein MK488_13580 [SAR324 cluster bacterium]|nr:hypothetical protein [SAR324 cluster bacterium]